MKKNKMMRIASVLLVAVLLSTCAISGTFAKYTTTFSGTSTAKVATWDVEVEEADVTTKTFTFNILETIKDADTGDEADATDNDVLAARLAPGTKGSFTITITNRSEVNATYEATLSYANNLPITFTVTNPNGNLSMTNGTVDIVVNWVWPYNSSDDEADMDLAGTDLTVTASIVVTQVD